MTIMPQLMKLGSNALFEQWHEVKRTIQEPQAFFELSIQEVTPMLSELARRLAMQCKQDQDMFRNTVVEELRAKQTEQIPEERIAEGIITFLENRYLLFHALDAEQPRACYESARTIREALTEIMSKVSRRAAVYAPADEVRLACGDFMRALEMHKLENVSFVGPSNSTAQKKHHRAIEKLRESCTVPLIPLCEHYDITPNARLGGMLNRQPPQG